MASRERRRSSGASRPRKECRNFKLLGSCENGDKCYYSHDVQLREDQRHEGYVPIPERLPISMAIGRHGSNLNPVYQVAECVVTLSARPDTREAKVVATSKRDLEVVKRKLEAMFSQLYPLGPTWCYLHAEGIAEATGSVLEFREHERLPTVKSKSAMYEVCCHNEVGVAASATPDTSVEDLERQFKSMQLDTVDSQHSALDVLSGTSTTTTVDDLAKTLVPSKIRVRITLNHQEQIRQQLQGGLDWFLKNRGQSASGDRTILKLEARFGKVLWRDLPEDILACQEPWGVQDFADFVFSDPKHIRSFNTNVKPENAERLRRDLADMADCKPTLETFDLKLSAGGEKLDVRLKVCSGGKLEVVVIRTGEWKLLIFDILCLHRQHDVRMSLNQLHVVSPSHPLFRVTQRILREVSFSEPGTLTLIPCTKEWNVNFIRHKKRTSYVLEEKYITTVTSVDEYIVGMKHPKGRPITIKPEDYSNHTEVEFHSIVWECAFGKDIGHDPAKSLALYMDQPTIDRDVATSIPHPWDAAAIVQDLDDILDNLETLNEFLGVV